MKLLTMLVDAFRSFWGKPATELYPSTPCTPPERLRGQLVWQPERCTGCALCVKDCPADAIQLITLDKASKRFVIHYDVGRCAFCGQCVQSCRFDCLDLANIRWSMSDTDKQAFSVYYGAPDDVTEALANTTASEDDEA